MAEIIRLSLIPVEVSDFINSAQSMLCIHGGEYRGKKMIHIPAPDDLEPIKPIAERTFPEWVAEISKSSGSQ